MTDSFFFFFFFSDVFEFLSKRSWEKGFGRLYSHKRDKGEYTPKDKKASLSQMGLVHK